MNWISSKICGILAAAATAFSFLLEIASLLSMILNVPVYECGVGMSFKLWIYSFLMACVSYLFYLADAGFSVVKAVKGEHRLFHILQVLVILGGIPILIFLGGSADYLSGAIWYGYYLLMLVLEIVSIVKARQFELYGN